MWARLTTGSFIGDLVNINQFWRLQVQGSDSTWRVVGYLPNSTSAQHLTNTTYTTQELAAAAMHALAAGLTPPDPS